MAVTPLLFECRERTFLILRRQQALGRRRNGFLGLSLNDRTILFLVIFLDKTVSVGYDRLCITTLACLLSQAAKRIQMLQNFGVQAREC